MTNREIIENALKRVNALAGTKGKLYKDNTGWYIINQNKSGDVMRLDESSRGVEAILSYLHGIEDALNFRFKSMGEKIAEVQAKVDKDMEGKVMDSPIRKFNGVIDDAFFGWED